MINFNLLNCPFCRNNNNQQIENNFIFRNENYIRKTIFFIFYFMFFLVFIFSKILSESKNLIKQTKITYILY